MAKHSIGWVALHKRWLLPLLLMLSVSTLIAFFIRFAFDSTCDRNLPVVEKRDDSASRIVATPSPLTFMKSKLVLLVSHELSLSGTLVFVLVFVFIQTTIIVCLTQLLNFVNLYYY